MNDEPNLERALLFIDGAHGIYVPRSFALLVIHEFVTGVSNVDWKILEAGPDHEHYWDAWADVCDNAVINHPTLGKCYLYQDGDLWVVPEE